MFHLVSLCLSLTVVYVLCTLVHLFWHFFNIMLALFAYQKNLFVYDSHRIDM